MTARMADALVSRGLLDRPRADTALRDVQRTGLGFGQLVTERGWVPEDVYVDILAITYGLERLRLASVRVDPKVVADLDESWVRSTGLLPLEPVPDRREVSVAVVDPENIGAIDALGFRLGRRLRLVAASRSELDLLTRHVFSGEALPYPTPPREPEPEGAARRDSDLEVLARAVSENKQAAEALRAIFDLCVERGLLSYEELERRVAEA